MSHLLAGGLLGKKYGKLGEAVSLQEYITSLAPIVYFPMLETSGTTAVNYGTLGSAANGTYSGATLAQVAAPGGGLAPLFDGVDDYLNAYTAALAAAYTSGLMSVGIWYKVYGSGDWTDGQYRMAFDFRSATVPANNLIQAYKDNLDNQLSLQYKANGTSESLWTTSYNNTNWNFVIITISKSAEQCKYYINGSLVETDVDLGVYAGSLGEHTTLIGAFDKTTAPSKVWHGYLCHAVVFDKVLTADEIAAIYAKR